jgi:hypothetical protein
MGACLFMCAIYVIQIRGTNKSPPSELINHTKYYKQKDLLLCHLKHFMPDFEVVHFCWPKNSYMWSALRAHCVTVYPTIILLLKNRVRTSENWILRTSPDSIQIQTCSGLLQKVSIYWLPSQPQPERDRQTLSLSLSLSLSHTHTHTHTHTCIIQQCWLSPCQIVCVGCCLNITHKE